MNIIKAIKSGKKFRRPHWNYWLHISEEKIVDDEHNWHFRGVLSDLLADDWEIEEEKIEITRTQFIKTFSDGMKKKLTEMKIKYYPDPIEDHIIEILSDVMKDLGFK